MCVLGVVPRMLSDEPKTPFGLWGSVLGEPEEWGRVWDKQTQINGPEWASLVALG